MDVLDHGVQVLVRQVLRRHAGTARPGLAVSDHGSHQVPAVVLQHELRAQQIRAAEVAAAHVVADSSCDLASGDCADAWITAFARQGFRRAVTPEDLDRLRTVFDVGLAEGEGPQLAVQLVIQTVLMSGSFLYHDEVAAEDAEDGDIVLVQDYALASRLSYFLWGSMPDEALLDAAAAGVLVLALGTVIVFTAE